MNAVDDLFLFQLLLFQVSERRVIPLHFPLDVLKSFVDVGPSLDQILGMGTVRIGTIIRKKGRV